MAFHTTPRVIILALDANRPNETAQSVRSAIDIGARPVVITRMASLKALRGRCEEAGCHTPDVEYVGVRDLRFDSAKKKVRRGLTRSPKWLLRRVLKVAGKFERRSIKPVSRIGAGIRIASRRAEPPVTRIATAVSSRVAERIIDGAGTGLTRGNQIRAAVRTVESHISNGHVIGVVCSDAGSLPAGWLIAKAYRGLSVHTSFPGEWSPNLPPPAHPEQGPVT